MLAKTITYTNYDGVEITETFRFNLTKAELTLWEASEDGGVSARLQQMVDSKNGKSIMATFYDVMMRSYGEKSADGKRFIKSPELSKAFSETAAFDIIFSEMMEDPEKALDFVQKVLPAELFQSNASA